MKPMSWRNLLLLFTFGIFLIVYNDEIDDLIGYGGESYVVIDVDPNTTTLAQAVTLAHAAAESATMDGVDEVVVRLLSGVHHHSYDPEDLRVYELVQAWNTIGIYQAMVETVGLDMIAVTWEAEEGAILGRSGELLPLQDSVNNSTTEQPVLLYMHSVGDRVEVLWDGEIYPAKVIYIHTNRTLDVAFEDKSGIATGLTVAEFGLKVLPDSGTEELAVPTTDAHLTGEKELGTTDTQIAESSASSWMVAVLCVLLTWVFTRLEVRRATAHFNIPNGTTHIVNGGSEDSWKKWGVDKKTIRRVTIPSSMTSIGKWAFSECSSLTSIEIPTSVIWIGQSAFFGCSSLVRVEIPSTVTSIGERAFSGCSSLKNVEIPSTVTNIRQYAFYGCSSLKSVGMPFSLNSIAKGTFWECSSLKSVYIPSTVTSIGERAFSGCGLLTSIHIPVATTHIGAQAFYGCWSLKSVDIPSKVTIIDAYTFSNCSSLIRVTIPASVTSINEYAFSGCSSLTSLEIPTSVTSIGENAFWTCKSLTALMVRSNTEDTNNANANVNANTATNTAESTIFQVVNNYNKDKKAAPVGAVDVGAAAAAGTVISTDASAAIAIIQAFNEHNEFPAVAKIWATDDIILELNGPFESYNRFADIPQPLRVAPDAKTWAGVQLWLWWLPPASFFVAGDSRVVSKSRQAIIWTVVLSAYKTSRVMETLPDLEPELWEHIFTFLKHDQQPRF